MRAALAYALRRTSSRIVLALGAGGVAFWLSKAVFDRTPRALPSACGPAYLPHALCAAHGVSTPWDLGVTVATVVVAMVAAAALWRRHRNARVAEIA